jgi:hypothetical protein
VPATPTSILGYFSRFEAENKRKEELEDKAVRKLAALLTVAESQKDQEAEIANALHLVRHSKASKIAIDVDNDFDDIFETSRVSRGRGVGSRDGRGVSEEAVGPVVVELEDSDSEVAIIVASIQVTKLKLLMRLSSLRLRWVSGVVSILIDVY